jgi:hypothetical protein
MRSIVNDLYWNITFFAALLVASFYLVEWIVNRKSTKNGH